MKDAIAIITEFCEMGDKHSFRLKNGYARLGWIFEVRGATAMYWDSGPCAAEGDIEVPIAEIDLGTLSYWHEAEHSWIDVRWDDDREVWVLTQFVP